MIYPMICEKCGIIFEVEATVQEYDDMIKTKFKCPSCNSVKIIRDWSKQELDIRWGKGFDRWKTIDKNFGYCYDPNKGNDKVGLNDQTTPTIKTEIEIIKDEGDFDD